MIVLFTDFGCDGPYVGQMEAVLKQQVPNVPIIHLLHNAPIGNPKLSAYLLAAFRHGFPENSIFLAVVDPGVGGSRKAVVLCADGQYFVGPDNGLFNVVAMQSGQTQWWEIIWRPPVCSSSFHGRDLFAPVAARLADGTVDTLLAPIGGPDQQCWPADLLQIIYFDHYRNAMTGMRYREEYAGRRLLVNGISVSQADTFCAMPEGQAFWYRNSSGLVEIAINQGRAQEQLKMKLGQKIRFF